MTRDMEELKRRLVEEAARAFPDRFPSQTASGGEAHGVDSAVELPDIVVSSETAGPGETPAAGSGMVLPDMRNVVDEIADQLRNALDGSIRGTTTTGRVRQVEEMAATEISDAPEPGASLPGPVFPAATAGNNRIEPLTRADLRRGIIMAEILGSPRSLKGWGEDF